MDTLLYFKEIAYIIKKTMGEFCLLVLSDEASYGIRVVGSMFFILYGLLWLANRAGGMYY